MSTLLTLRHETIFARPRAPLVDARRLLAIDVDGARLVATHHVAARPRQTGVLFVNFGYAPRDGHGGLAAIASDRLAGNGFHAFRVDLPALGDSEGDLPRQSAPWFERIRSGGFADVTLKIAREILEQHRLEKLVVGGLCGGSITAIWARDRDADGRIAGIILLEPEMYTADMSPEGQVRSCAPSGASALTRARRVARKALSYWSWARVVTGESPYARYLPVPRWALLRLLEARSSDLPPMTNLPLVAAWQSVVRSRTPALVVTAEGKIRELFLDRVNRVAVPDYPTRWIEHVRVPHTNHIFTTGGAISIVTDVVARWMLRTFGS